MGNYSVTKAVCPNGRRVGRAASRYGDRGRWHLFAAVPFLVLAGCSGAPSFVLFGAYFPAWMMCAGIGLFSAIALRLFMVASGLSQTLPAQLALSTATAVLAGTVAWLLWFGR